MSYQATFDQLQVSSDSSTVDEDDHDERAALRDVATLDTNDMPLPCNLNQRARQRLRMAVIVVVGSCIVLAVIDSLTTRRLEALAYAFLEWVADHPILGLLSVIVVYTIATICFCPASVLTLGTGFAFRHAFGSFWAGVSFAVLAVFLGATCGSICSFFLGRYLFRDSVLRLAHRYPLFRAIDRALEHQGFTIMLLLRLSPLVPYNVLDYVSGVTSISFRHYALALLGLLPGTTLFCSLGALASSLTESASVEQGENGGLRTFAMVFGVVFAFAGVVVTSYYSKKELDAILRENGHHEETGSNDPT